MKRVVLVAPEFPPSNSAGAHRPRLFAKHLPAFGWTPTVLTIRRELIEGPLDPMLDRLVDPMLDVVRTGALPIRPLRVIGDLGLRTLWPHASALAAAARRGELDAMVLFGPPWFSFVLGPLMRRRFGTPFVVDYIDPWISEWTAAHRWPSKGWFYHRSAVAIEPGVLRSAAHITAVSDGILSDLRTRYRWLDSTRMTAMPYGAEPEDIEASARLHVEPPDFLGGGDELTMSFTGAIQPNGGAILRAVLRALGDLVRSGSVVGRRIHLRAYGTSNLTWGHDRFAVVPVARELGIDARVSELPQRVPYLQAMAVLRSCDIVLVMGSADRYYHASKLYPAIVSGRPILAICHADSSIRQVMDVTGAGICITFGDVGEIERLTPQIHAAIETLGARAPLRPASATIERFTAHASTASLARILDGMVAQPARAEAM